MLKVKYLLPVSLFVCATGIAAAQQDPAIKDDTKTQDTITISRAVKGVTVTGKITDAITGKPAPGIRVQVGNFSAVITDDNGNFSLPVPSYNSTLQISGEGYDLRFVPLQGKKEITVALLDESHESIHETINTSTGLQIKRNLTASVASHHVNGMALPTETADALLQGRVAGLNVVRRSGLQGAGANLFMRGYNSLYATNKPLIVVDNLLFDANEYGQSIIANNYTNPFSLIDLKDVDNITVLPDASSIYGTKGANGAIIITTSRPKSQATRIDFAAYTGINQAPEALPVMNAADYRIYLSELLQSRGLTSSQIAALPYMNDDPSADTYSMYHFNTNWQKKVFQNSLANNYFLKVTGGDNIAMYGLSVGYMKNQGIINETDLSRFNMRFNAEFNFTKKFTGFANLSLTYNEQNMKDQGMADKTAPVFLSLVKSPFLHDHDVDSKGVESPNLADTDPFGISNPAAIIKNMKAYNKYYRFMGTVGFRYKLPAHLTASTMMGVVFDKIRENIFVPSVGAAKDTLSNAVADNRLGTQVKRLFSIYNDSRLEYNRNFTGAHKFTAMAGIRFQHNRAEQDYALGFNSATDDLVNVQNGVNALRQVGGGIGVWNWINTYVNAEYNYHDKYFLSFNMAMDASSRFGKQAAGGMKLSGHPFALMPSIGAAWLISSENFMAHSPINVLKLRATYGISGNDDIGNYTSRKTYSSQNLLGMQGLVRNGIANPALQWETVHKLNAGIDVAFLNERAGITVDVFRSRTTNMLTYEELGTATGFSTILTNNGSMKNTGIEVSANYRILNKTALKWDLGVVASTYKNRIGSVPNEQFITNYAGAAILTANGQAANQFYGYVAQGVYATDADAAAAGLKKKNYDGTYSSFSGGDIIFLDRDNNQIIDENDRQVIGNPNPAFTGGISNRIIWKRLELNTLFTFSHGNDVYNYLRYRLEAGNGVENQLTSLNNRWRSNGQVTNTPRANWGDPMGNSRFSNRWIEDGSYFRLRSVSLQYYIPVKNAMVHNATVYVSGTNLFTLTRYKGFDPEFSAGSSLFVQGIDTGLDPLFRSVTVGIRIGL
ncbi:SusC/RagA family TonB-linked outer membrane protein [Niastella populi]|uniref:SusC/RagA family TonB-linked outer membrane protein n=2 Tax=Niastella populi TaxID=550983 RepID=A0A1V9G6J8_9BACT|nr:SusC/RagA family TonB-linked outer membrane protein [Niastella populi]